MEATADLQQAEAMRSSDPACADWLATDAGQRLALLEQPATAEQLATAGAVVGQQDGKLCLRDTAQAPTLLAASANGKRLALPDQAGAL